MTEEQVKPNGGWTFHTLFLFFDRRIHDTERLIAEKEARYLSMFASREEATKLALDAADRAVTKSEASVERRFEGVNEFREAMNDQQKTYITRREYETAHSNLVDKIDSMASANASAKVMNIVLAAAATGIFGMLGYLIFIHIR